MEVPSGKPQNIDWTIEKLEHIGVIKSYDGENFYVEGEENFKRLAGHWRGSYSPLVEESGLFVLKSQGKTLIMDIRKYCANYKNGSCGRWKDEDRLSCAAKNQYCHRDFRFQLPSLSSEICSVNHNSIVNFKKALPNTLINMQSHK